MVDCFPLTLKMFRIMKLHNSTMIQISGLFFSNMEDAISGAFEMEKEDVCDFFEVDNSKHQRFIKHLPSNGTPVFIEKHGVVVFVQQV